MPDTKPDKELSGYFIDLSPKFQIDGLDQEQMDRFLLWAQALDDGVQQMHELALQTLSDQETANPYILFVEGVAKGMSDSLTRSVAECNDIKEVYRHLFGTTNALVSLCLQIGRAYERKHPEKGVADGASLG